MKIFDTGDLTPSTPLTPDERSWIYNGLDCALTAEIWDSLAAEVDNIADNIYRNISRPLQAPILAMNMTGILTDQVTVAEMLNTLRLDIEKTAVRLRRLASEGYGYDFAPAEFTASGRQKRGDALNSSDEIGRFLYEYIGLPEKRKRNQKGGFSRTTDRQALESLAESFYHVRPFIWHLLELRDLTKQVQFLSTEIDPDGRMRCNFNIAGTNTGRLSSSYSDMGTGTNLQNVGRRLRVVFVAPKGKKFANLDLEQADSRNVGATCWNRFVEPYGEAFAGSYLDACESGDLHTRVTRMARPELAWPEDERAWRSFADAPQDIFRGKSYRDLSKNLGHGCLTADHEVLTKSGWVAISTMPDEIYTWSPSGGNFAPVSRWTNFIAPRTVEITGLAFSLKATPDHRLPREHNQKIGTIRVEDLPMKSGRILLDGAYIGGTVTVPARLIAAIMSDGELTGNKARFHFHKERKKARLRQLAKTYNIPYTEHPDGRISIAYSHPKNLGPYALTWTRECIRDFVDEYSFWDGHRALTAKSCMSVNRQQIEWLQTLGRLVGVGGNIQRPQTSGFGSTVYRLQQNARSYADISRLTLHHDDTPVEVFCPTVPSSWFLVRRDGKISVTGNSNYLLSAASAVLKIPGLSIDQAKEFNKKYFEAFKCIPLWHAAVWDDLKETSQITTIWGRRRYFFGRPEDHKTLRTAVAYEGQSATADEINQGLLRLYREGQRFPGFRLCAQVHDSVLFEYDEECENEIIPWAINALRVPLMLARGREFVVPTEAKVGWNWGDYNDDPKRGRLNLDGLQKWKGGDKRVRLQQPRTIGSKF